MPYEQTLCGQHGDFRAQKATIRWNRWTLVNGVCRVMGAFRSSLAAILLTFVLPAILVLPALAQGDQSLAGESGAPALPAALSESEIRDFVSRLSDTQAREILLQQLDTAARQQTATQQPDTGLVRTLRGSLQQLREGLVELGAVVGEVPAAGPMIVARLTAGGERGIGPLLLAAAGIFAAALAGEQLFRRLFAGIRPAPSTPAGAMSFVDKLCILVLRLIAELLSIAVFAMMAVAIFFVFYAGHEPVRAAFAALLWAIVLPWTAAAVTRFAVAPRLPELRLVRLGDKAARAIFRSSVILVGVISAAVLLNDFLVAVGLRVELRHLFGTTVSLVILSLIIVGIWRWRRQISRSILEGDETASSGGQPSRVRQLVAANWHVFAGCFIAGIWMTSTVQRLLTGDPPTVPILVSLAILFAIPVADAAVRSAVSAMLKIRPPAPEGPADEALSAPAAAGMDTMRVRQSRMRYRTVLVRNLRLVLIVIAIVVLARVWGVDMHSVAARGVGETVAGALFEIVIILVLASAAWGIVKIAIANAVPERDAGESEGEIGGTGRSRSETLLPLIGTFILVAIVAVTVLAVLSALGVAIGPLIAGAGVIGIAIGFGAQTLVRDVLSGIFFLIDDAFRTGEYIDTGSVRGMVEHISIRSLRLRHHRGPLHTIPFGEIHHLTNFSRDWAIEKLELRVPYDTDLEKVRKIIKSVGQELMEHPEHGPNFIQPLKSQGVNRMDDSAFIVRVKFMAKPGQQFVLRREIFRRIQQAFSDNGIHFAPRRVIVETAAGAVDPKSAAAAIAAAEDMPDAPHSRLT